MDRGGKPPLPGPADGRPHQVARRGDQGCRGCGGRTRLTQDRPKTGRRGNLAALCFGAVFGLAPRAPHYKANQFAPPPGFLDAERTDIRSILIIGAGPIVIGQACEFDYSGAQACKALREEGYRVILVNSNPARS